MTIVKRIHEKKEVDEVFCTAHTLADDADILLTMPRLVSKQTARNNVDANSPSEYFKRAIWYPYLNSRY